MSRTAAANSRELWKCTWFFCDPLLRSLHEGPQKKARALSAAMERIIGLYNELDQAAEQRAVPRERKGEDMTKEDLDICAVCGNPRPDCICCPE